MAYRKEPAMLSGVVQFATEHADLTKIQE